MSTSNAPLVAWLGSAGSDVASLGGKGASLDRLARLGFRVPAGFCLTTAAFRAEVAVDPSLRLPDDVAAALADATQRLVTEVAATTGGAARFAVRSSAIGEDGSTASYAGLHETELGVRPDGVAGAVRRCWASLWSPAAVAYRDRRGIEPGDASMAVVVQALVPAESSAVAFTRHPVTHRDDQLVLTAVRGLGDAMVAGTVTPDTFVVDKPTREVRELQPGDDGGASLSDGALASLVELCLAVEGRLGQAVDIEAAFAAGTWFLLQARPITTGAAGSTDAVAGPAGVTA